VAALYADENVRFDLVDALRALGHDVLTALADGRAGQGIPDSLVLARATHLGRAVVTGELRQVMGRQWVDDKLASLNGHLIVCGHGRMGRIVCAELDRQKRWFVLLDANAGRLTDAHYRFGLPLAGDATGDELLRKAGVEPVVHLIADAGFENYQTTLNISKKMVDEKKDLVQRFMDATIEGWAQYMRGENVGAANALIIRDNPEMDASRIAYAVRVMNEQGIVTAVTRSLWVSAR